MAISSLTPTHPLGLLVLAITTVASLGLLLGCGWFLVPSSMLGGSGKLLRLAVRLASGIVFAAGLAAFVCLRHLNYMSWLAIGQLLFAGWAYWKCISQPAESDEDACWSWKEAAWMGAIALVLIPVYQVPYQYNDTSGQVLQLHADLGYGLRDPPGDICQRRKGWLMFKEILAID